MNFFSNRAFYPAWSTIRTDPFSAASRWNRAVRMLIGEEGMGPYFYVRIQSNLPKLKLDSDPGSGRAAEKISE